MGTGGGSKGVIEDVRNLLQDIVSPDIKAIKARLDTLEGTIHHLGVCPDMIFLPGLLRIG